MRSISSLSRRPQPYASSRIALLRSESGSASFQTSIMAVTASTETAEGRLILPFGGRRSEAGSSFLMPSLARKRKNERTAESLRRELRTASPSPARCRSYSVRSSRVASARSTPREARTASACPRSLAYASTVLGDSDFSSAMKSRKE